MRRRILVHMCERKRSRGGIVSVITEEFFCHASRLPRRRVGAKESRKRRRLFRRRQPLAMFDLAKQRGIHSRGVRHLPHQQPALFT